MPKLTVGGLLNQLRADLRGDTERGKLVRSAGMTAGLKIGATLLAFGASLLYARALGPHDYGLYAYVIAWTAVLTVPAGLGLPQYLVREGAKAPQSLNWLRRWADKRALIAGLIVAALLACAVFIPAAAGARWLFVIAAPLPLLNNLGAIRRSLLQSYGWIARSQWPQLLLAPAIMLVMLAGLWLWHGRLQPFELVATTVAVALLPLLANALQLRRATLHIKAERQTPIHVRSALPFMWLGGLYLLISRTDLIMLGAMRGAHDAGIYAVASRTAELVSFFAATTNITLAPQIARLYNSGKHALLQRMLRGASQRFLILTIPLALLLVFAARPLLHYFYGADYAEGAIILQILAGVQFIVLAMGSVNTILNMTGNERLSSLGVGLAAILNIALNALLIPGYGSKGAAIATGISLITAQVLLWYWVRHRLGLRPSGLGF